MTENMNWSFSQVWNRSLESGQGRELKPRNRIWASEMGGSMIDRYLKMKAEPFSNPFNPRSLRKFEAGNMIEWLAKMVLKRAGILLDCQTWLGYQYPNLLEVSGKLDFLAGGQHDWSQSKHEIDNLGLPEFFYKATTKIIDYLASTYPKGLKEIVLEIKSCSGMMFDKYERSGASKNHELQAFHYLKAKKMDEAHIIYISKDDLRMLELGVFNPSETENRYKNDIETITKYFNGNKQPPLEKEVQWEEKFSQNWKLAYSNYISKLYGFENQKAYEDKIKPMIAQWNRVLKRCIQGDKMTDKNLAVIVDIKKSFPDFDLKVQELKTKNIVIEDEENGGNV